MYNRGDFVVLLQDQTNSTMTGYHTQSHYHDTESASSCPILIMLSALLESDKYQFYVMCLTR